MQDDASASKEHRVGLVVTLFFWFMTLSIGPVLVVGFNEYQMGRDEILKDRYDQLTTMNFQLTQRVNQYFDNVLTNLYILAAASERMVYDLTEAQQLSKHTLPQFINSEAYEQVYNIHTDRYERFVRFYDYADFLVGDAQGNILYSVNGYSDLGKNLFSSELSSSQFAQAVSKSLKDQQPKYADLEPYAPADNEKVFFYVLPLTDNDFNSIGFIAVQIHPNNIQSMFDGGQQIISGLSSYLVGTDRKIRFGTNFRQNSFFTFDEANPLMTDWLSDLDAKGNYHEPEEHLEHDENAHSLIDVDVLSGEADLHDESTELTHAVKASINHVRSYTHNEEVLGIFLPINIAGTPMMMLSEVSQEKAFASVFQFRDRLLILIAITFVVVFTLSLFISRRLVRPIRLITQWVNRVASGDYIETTVLKGSNEIGLLSRSFTTMTDKLRRISEENRCKSWLQDGLAGLHNSVRGEQSINNLCYNIVAYMVNYLGMQTGALYVKTEDDQLALCGSYALDESQLKVTVMPLGSGLVGQAAVSQEMIEIANVPEHCITLQAAVGEIKPSHIIVLPLAYENQVNSVFEFSRLGALNDDQRLFLEYATESIAIAIKSAQYRTRVSQLLETTTEQSQALQKQQQELQQVNSELEKRADTLEESEEELKAQSEELQKSNVELEELSEKLLLQKEEIELKNRDIERSSKKIADKAEELARISQYKSEFLANMSHELRTPLNSLLLLSKILADNTEGNLTEEQIESIQVIHGGGKELLSLINDILDLSKVEAGKMAINLEYMPLVDIKDSIERQFKVLADDRGLGFVVEMAQGLDEAVFTDGQRVLQIMKNFLSNAFKFTEQGQIEVHFFEELRKGKFAQDQWLGISVKDSGIGIPEEKQASIFESFQQADGSTSRKYGGTGLGLAISRELASLLGGFIELSSEEGKGTTFTLYLPVNAVCSLSSEALIADSYRQSSLEYDGAVTEDEALTQHHESQQTILGKLLIIEDDLTFVKVLTKTALRYQFECLHAATGATGLSLAQQQPQAIILDLGLPDMSGEEVLAQLKANPLTQNIPVHIVSAHQQRAQEQQDASGFLAKPINMSEIDQLFSSISHAMPQDEKNILIYAQDIKHAEQISEALYDQATHIESLQDLNDIRQLLQRQQWQCLVIDVTCFDQGLLDFLHQTEQALQASMPALIVHADNPIDRNIYQQLQRFKHAAIMKSDYGLDRIADEASLFLHHLREPEKTVEKTPRPADSSELLNGHKVLLVDDDLRNTFALSKVLQGFGIKVVLADNGESALQKLQESDDIELVLMDIMMPVMDGYEAMKHIRQMPAYVDLPMIALTAKAMANDKEKCLEAGASDYMPKPIDTDKLIAMLKVWLLK